MEESGIITFNKFFENKKGKLSPEGVEEYVDSGEREGPPSSSNRAFVATESILGWNTLSGCYSDAELCALGITTKRHATASNIPAACLSSTEQVHCATGRW